MDPEFSRSYHRRGLAKEGAGDKQGALKDFDRAIELDPQYGVAYYSRATLKANLGREDDAAADMEVVVHLTRQNLESFANANNVWRSEHLRVEDALESELTR